MSADHPDVPEPARMCHEDVEDYAGFLLDDLRAQVETLTAERDAARTALADALGHNRRLAESLLNLGDDAPEHYAYTPAWPSPVRMHSML